MGALESVHELKVVVIYKQKTSTVYACAVCMHTNVHKQPITRMLYRVNP